MKDVKEYLWEDIRNFIVKRQWLLSKCVPYMITEQEYEALKTRKLQINRSREVRLRAFIEGWQAAKV